MPIKFLMFLVLLASSHLSTTLLAQLSSDEPLAHYDRDTDAHPYQVFMQEGGWCWYQDPRVIICQDKLLIGGVQGNAGGDAVVGVFDLVSRQSLGRAVLHEAFKHDDHNCPVFYARPDGRVLAVYALHGNNSFHYYRISKSDDFLEWEDEQQFEHDYPDAGNVTYMNLFALSSEGKLYNFFRGIDWNPCFITSADGGSTWGEPTKFIRSELPGRQRPYARYTSNHRDTIYVSFTDAHPHVFGNSIHFAFFRDGRFYSATGKLIKDLRQDGPLKPSEAELVFQGGGGPGRGPLLSAEQSAWTSSMTLDQHGHPHIGYTLYVSNTDHRYRIASWNGTRWIDREIAYGGSCLYDRESSYTGLITLDPRDPTRVVISTDVDPTTGQSLRGHHEIYQARVEQNDDRSTVDWQAITSNSSVDNLRPVIVSDGGHRIILWLRGDFVSYTDYQLDVVGRFETVD